MKKTFYSVDRAIWGKDGLTRCWFDNLEEAKKVSSQDYSDKVITHTFSDEWRIESVEKLVEWQKNWG